MCQAREYFAQVFLELVLITAEPPPISTAEAHFSLCKTFPLLDSQQTVLIDPAHFALAFPTPYMCLWQTWLINPGLLSGHASCLHGRCDHRMKQFICFYAISSHGTPLVPMMGLTSQSRNSFLVVSPVLLPSWQRRYWGWEQGVHCFTCPLPLAFA